MLKYFLILLLVGCGAYGERTKDKGGQTELADQIRDKRDFYLQESGLLVQTHAWGWPDATGDAFLWACLYNAGGGQADYTLAILPDGRPQRNPAISPSQSKTPWSKDMEIGLLWCLYKDPNKTRAKEVLTKHIAYGRANKWDLCGPAPEYKIGTVDRISRCRISGALQATAYRLYGSLGGKCDDKCQLVLKNPLNSDMTGDVDGYQEHLAMIHRFLRARLSGGATPKEMKSMSQTATQEPNNALYQCIWARFHTGDTTRAAALLLDESKFPAGRLPSKAEVCTEYVYQRAELIQKNLRTDAEGCISYLGKGKQVREECGLDPAVPHARAVYNPDWLPCGSEEDVKVPVDFLFAASCVLGE